MYWPHRTWKRSSAASAAWGSELTENYTICHHNWLYKCLEPSDDEIIAAYLTLNGPEPRDSDAKESSDDDSGNGADESDAGEEAMATEVADD